MHVVFDKRSTSPKQIYIQNKCTTFSRGLYGIIASGPERLIGERLNYSRNPFLHKAFKGLVGRRRFHIVYIITKPAYMHFSFINCEQTLGTPEGNPYQIWRDLIWLSWMGNKGNVPLSHREVLCITLGLFKMYKLAGLMINLTVIKRAARLEAVVLKFKKK